MDDVQALNPPGLTDAQSAWLNRVLHVDLSAVPTPSAPPQTSPPSGNAMRPDCEIVRNKVPGPKHHVLCATHRHILDETTKTIIAADMAEYKQKFPPPKHAAPADTKKGASRPQAAQSAVPEPVGAMPDLKPIPVPKLVGGDKAAFVQEMSALDTLKPSKDHPDQYIAMLNGKETPVAKAGADAIRDKARKSLTSAIGFVSGTCDNAADSYKSQKAINDDQWVVSKLAAAVQSVKSLGKYQDPGADVTKLVASARAGLNEARGALGGNKFGLAAALIADAEGKATQANQMVMAWINGAISGADTSVTVLKHTKTASFAVVSGLAAVGTGGTAGLIAAAVLPTLAEAGGKALAGEEIDWSAAVIEMGMNLLLAKFGKGAEAAVSHQVEAMVTKRLAGRIAEDKLKLLAAKAGEKAAKELIGKGSDLLKGVLTTVATRFKGKKMTWGEMMQAVLDSLNNPEAKEAAKIQGAVEKILASATPKA